MVENEATSPEENATAGAGPNPTPPRRPPVTIDLAANPVESPEPSSASGVAEPDDDAGPPGSDTEYGDEDLPPSPPPADARPALPQIGGVPLMPLAVAAAAGALAALIIAFLAATSGLISTPGARDASAALGRVEKLEAGLDAARATEGQIATEVQAVSARLAGVETMARDLLTTTEQLRGVDSTSAANEALINTLAAQVSDLRATIKSIGTIDPNAPANGPEVAALSARLDEMATRLAAIGDKPVTESQTAAAARTMAFAGLQSAAERGEPFGEELRLLSMLGVEASMLAPLEPGKDGVPTTAALTAEFDKVGNDIIAASDTVAPDTNLFWRVVHQLGSVVTIRPSGPVAGTTPVAIVSRMRAAVDARDLEAALRERDGLPDVGKTASEGWARSANARVTLDKAVAGLAGAIDTASARE